MNKPEYVGVEEVACLMSPGGETEGEWRVRIEDRRMGHALFDV